MGLQIYPAKGLRIYKLALWVLIVTPNSEKRQIFKYSNIFLDVDIYTLTCQLKKLTSCECDVTIQKINHLYSGL